MPHLDRLTMEEIIKKFELGDVAGGRAEVEDLAPRYPNDEALQQANALLGEEKQDEALAVLKDAVITRLRGFQSRELPFSDIRSKEDRTQEGR